jgi:hypothetical protein
MSRSLLATPVHQHARHPRTTTSAASSAHPATERLLRELAFVCRLTERVKEAVVGRKGVVAESIH